MKIQELYARSTEEAGEQAVIEKYKFHLSKVCDMEKVRLSQRVISGWWICNFIMVKSEANLG